MATKPPLSEKEKKIIRQREAKLEQDLLKYETILRSRELQYQSDALFVWDDINTSLQKSISELYARYSDADGKLIPSKEFEAARLLALQRQGEYMFDKVAGTEARFQNELAFNYVDSYFFSAFALQQAVPYVAVATPVLTESAVMGVVANPWLGDGKTYSDRNRANVAMLAAKMKETLTEATGGGWSVHRTARAIQERTGEGYNNSVRLARTEFTRAASQGSSHCFMQNADVLSGKRWNATLDARTAPKDAKNDGDIFPLDYDTPENPGEPGKRIPNHPNCRCKWSPVLASLGVREGERIARGEGDTKDTPGKRIYTKARTYKEYAKERGIDLDEALRKDNPSRYLRRGEKPATGSPAAEVISGAVSAAATASALSAADRARQVIGSGLQSEEQTRKVGEIIADDALADFEERYPALLEAEVEAQTQLDTAEAELKAVIAEREQLVRQNPTDPKAAELLRKHQQAFNNYKALRDKRNDIKITTAQARASVVLEKLAEVRQMGSVEEHKFAKGSTGAVKDAIRGIQKFYPTSWLEKSHAHTILDAKKVKRGYYRTGQVGTSDFRISGDTARQMEKVALHELGHRMEEVLPELRKLEKQFYDYRTKGEDLKWLGSGYAKTEKTRFDNFLSPYMGKDYGNKDDSYFELFTMGVEGLFYGSTELHKDREYYNFILGVLAGL